MEPDQFMIDARARIIWGESPSSVRGFLMAHGVTATDANAKIKSFQLERNSGMRSIAIRNTIAGGTILVAEGITFYPFYRYLDSISYTGGVRLMIGYAIGGLYGLWRLGRGLVYLLRPQSDGRLVTDIYE